MTLENVEAFLKDTIGLDVGSIGPSAIARAVRQRCAHCSVADTQRYWDYLRSSPSEQQELIEAVIVPETWFFRYPEALGALLRQLREHPGLINSGVRLLSLPCSTGEEPYSIAMALLDAGLRAEHFRLDAVDISERAIAHALRGLYGRNSFRGAEVGFRERHFEEATDGYKVSESVRRQVRFRQANLLAEGAFTDAGLYDAIFCRNVLIYFDQPARQRAVALLHRLLTPTGTLFVGPAEGPLLSESLFTPTRIPLAFAYVRAAPSSAKAARRPARTFPRTSPAVHPKRDLPKLPSSVPAAPAPDGLLEQARKLADQGRFDEAMERCAQHLRAHSHSVEGHYLCGLLCDARGESAQARDHYRRALYLDPSHYEALTHLAETLRAAGDHQGAQQLLERARRAQSRGRTA